MTEEMYHPGLEGVIAGETDICSVEQGGLSYRGFGIADLARHATFEETAYLLLYGELPDAGQLQALREKLDYHRALPPPVLELLRVIPQETPTMDVLRTAVSLCGHFGLLLDDGIDAWRNQAICLCAQVGTIIAARHRMLAGLEPVDPAPDLSHAAQLLHLFNGEDPDPSAARLMDLTMILYAEHEYNASTFAARVCASTLSDLTSCIVAAIGTLKGPLHGGANEAAMLMLKQFKNAQQARQWTLDAIATKKKIMGFGHRVYRHGDHRAHILEERMRALAKQLGREDLVAIYDAVKQTMQQEKGIFPNVDYPCGLTYYLMDLPIDAYTPLFVASRVVGWSAHVIEQHFNNRLIRPISRYTGPAQRSFTPLSER